MKQYSSIWSYNKKRFGSLEPTKDNLLKIQRSELYSVQTDDPNIQQRCAYEWERILDTRHPGWRSLNVEESVHVPSEFTFFMHGRRVSCDFYKKLNIALEVLKTRPSSVIEIGPGYGQVVRLLHLISGVRCSLVDLPTSIIWCKKFLEMHNIPCEYILAGEHKTGAQYDTLVNTSSLGEMPISVAKDYLRYFSYGIVKHSVYLNRLLNTYCPYREVARENEAGWYFFVDPNAYVEQWELEPDFTRINGPDWWGHHREVFMVVNHNRSAHLNEPMGQEVIIKTPASRTNNILWPDKKRLQILLENVRVCGFASDYKALLSYLHRCSLRYPFEETFLLKKMLAQRLCKKHYHTQKLRYIPYMIGRFLHRLRL